MLIPVRIGRERPQAPSGLLIRGDASGTLPELEGLRGQVQCVYIDPPFMTGKVFQRKRPMGEADWGRGRLSLTLPGYDDRFPDRTAYLDFLRGLLEQSRALLKETGVLYLHLDWRASAWGRLLCDEVFGEKNFLNEIIWSYDSGGTTTRHFPRKHDTILMIAASPAYRFDITRVPVGTRSASGNHMRRETDEDGRTYRSIRSGGKVYRYYDDDPVYPGDVWTDISHLQQKDPERTGYATQKPLKLLERLLLPVTSPGDLVADLCCGSGTALAAAERLGCGFVGADASAEALNTIPARLNAPCELAFPTEEGGVLAEAVRLPDGRLQLTAFHEDGMDTQGTDAAEQWRVGLLEGDVLRVTGASSRSFRHPELEPLTLPQGGTAALVITSARGRRYGFLRQEQE